MRISYKCDIGSDQILNAGNLLSANAFLKRLYVMADATSGEESKEDPKFEFFGKGTTFKPKKVSAKMKITTCDLLQKSIFDDFLGIAKTGEASKILVKCGFKGTIDDLKNGGREAWEKAEKMLDKHIDKLYNTELIPISFFVSCLGIMPDGLDAKAETADDIQKRLPDLKISKDEKEGSFFQIGHLMLTVYPEEVYFSTGKAEVETDQA